MPTIGHMIINDESPDAIRDEIISSLYAKAAERVEAAKPFVVANVFDDEVEDDDEYDEYDEEDEDEDYEDDED